MSDKDKFDIPLGDEDYDDALDESFEFEDYDDIDLSSESDGLEGDDSYDGGGESDWEDDGQEDQESLDSFQPRKSFINFNSIVIAGAVLVGIYVLIAQVQPEPPKYGEEVKKEKFTTALTMQGAFSGPGAIKKEDIESLKVSSEKELNQEDGFLFDTDLVDVSKEVVDNTPPMPSPIVSDTNESEEVGEAEVGDENILVESVELEERKIEPVSRAPEKTIEKNNLDALEVEQALMEKDTVQETVVDKTPLIISDVTDSKNIDIIPEEVPDEKVKQVLAFEATPTASLNKSLENIIQRLDGMETKINDFQKSNIEKIEIIAADIDALKRDIPKVSEASVEKESVAQPVQVKKQFQAKAVVPKKTVKKAVPKIVWELRAAQPSKAWVSKKGQKEMRPVVVGDKLSGIGRVQGILYSNGKWTVQGTSGKITQ